MESHQRIMLTGTFNTRDYGGCPAENGKRIKPGIFYRSDSLHQLTAKDVKVIQSLGIRTIVDFRTEAEREKEPDIVIAGIEYQYFTPDAEIAALGTGNIVNDQEKIDALLEIAATKEGRDSLLVKADEMAEQMRDLVRSKYSIRQYRKFLDLLEDTGNTPILHHCKGGKDRAGLAAILVQLILGVPKELIVKDYMRTKANMAERNKKRMNEYERYTNNYFVLEYLSGLMQTKTAYIEAAFDEMEQLAGSAQNYIRQYMGISSAMAGRLKEFYLTGD